MPITNIPAGAPVIIGDGRVDAGSDRLKLTTGFIRPYIFDSSLADADPGVGELRMNDGTADNVTFIYFDDFDAIGDDATKILDALDTPTIDIRAHIQISKNGDPTKWIILNVAGTVTSAATYRKVPVEEFTASEVASGDAVPFAAGDLLTVAFIFGLDASGAGGAGPTGATGPVGPAAPPGIHAPPSLPGIPGARGTDGLTGATGPAGATAPPGLLGADGIGGTPGSTGARGDTGPAGPTAPPGLLGADGLNAPPGPAGAQGLQGDVGPSAPPGLQGEQGYFGLPGAEGSTGPIGPIGNTGPSAPPGLLGADGLSAPPGAAGAQGITGPTGPSAPPGLLGADGIGGIPGARGADGAAGATGATGTTGATGATGAAGPPAISHSNALPPGPGFSKGTDQDLYGNNRHHGLNRFDKQVDVNALLNIDQLGISHSGNFDLAGANVNNFAWDATTIMSSFINGGGLTGIAFTSGSFIIIRNIDSVDSLTLFHLNAGSSSSSQFICPGNTDFVMPPSSLAICTHAPTGQWLIVGVRALTAGNAITITAGVIDVLAATSGEQEAGVQSNRVTTPVFQQRHPSACKAWARATPGNALSASYNVSSSTDTAAGIVVFALTVSFSTTSWCPVTGCSSPSYAAAGNMRLLDISNRTASALDLRAMVPTAVTAIDPAEWNFAGYGDQ